MSNLTLQVKTDSVPAGFCFENWQKSFPELVQLLSVIFPMANGGMHIGETPPAAQYQDWPWLKINATTHKPERIYTFNQGDWVAPYPFPASAYFVTMWTGSAASIPTIDGGDSGTITDRTGAFWEIDTAMEGFMPIGVGNIGQATTDPTAVTVGVTGGEENVTITETQIPDHNHVFGVTDTTDDVSLLKYSSHLIKGNGETVARDTFFVQGMGDSASIGTASSGNLITGGFADTYAAREAHNNMPPYYPVYFIKRTARIFYKAT